jgi:repressor of nif and glnA expression
MTARNLVSNILSSQKDSDLTAKEVASAVKSKGLFISERNVSFILLRYDNFEKRLFQIVGAIE